MKPVLFIDVDGVLFGIYEGYFQLRPNVIGFLDWCVHHFDCYWLTCWDFERLKKLMNILQGLRLADQIDYCHWPQYEHNKARGALAYAPWREFYWIEDGLPEDEIKVLESAGKLERYIYVHPEGRDELERIKGILEEKLGYSNHIKEESL